MSSIQIEFLVEEPSMEEVLKALCPKLLGQVPFRVFPFRSKSDLLKNLPKRLKGYASWTSGPHRIVVLLDRDTDDCRDLKATLEKHAEDAGLTTRSTAGGGPYRVLNRIVVEELEAWFFGDWEAVQAAYPRAPEATRKAPFRDPDAIAGGTWERFEQVLRKGGYFQQGLRKLEATRAIAPHLDPARNRSKSFICFRDALTELVQPETGDLDRRDPYRPFSAE